MRIQKITLDAEDLKQAVQAFLATQGITIPVESISREYNWEDFTVNFVEEAKTPPPRKYAGQVVTVAEPAKEVA